MTCRYEIVTWPADKPYIDVDESERRTVKTVNGCRDDAQVIADEMKAENPWRNYAVRLAAE